MSWRPHPPLAFAALAALVMPARAEMSTEELAKLAQNPVGNLISVPFRNNTNFDLGPEKGTQNVLNIKPVIPIEVNRDWNIITRTILPVISEPALVASDSRTNGIGDLQFTAFLSPANPGHWIWAVGPIVQTPIHSDDLGNDHWGLGRRSSWGISVRGAPGSTACSWTVPLGGGVGKIFHLGELPVNTTWPVPTTRPTGSSARRSS